MKGSPAALATSQSEEVMMNEYKRYPFLLLGLVVLLAALLAGSGTKPPLINQSTASPTEAGEMLLETHSSRE